MNILFNFLGQLGLMGPESNYILLGGLILFITLLVISLAKKLIHAVIIFGCFIIILGSAFFVKLSVLDNNGVQLEKTRIVTINDSMNYADIESVYLRDNNKVILQDKNGDEMILNVDSKYANTIKSVLDGIIKKEK